MGESAPRYLLRRSSALRCMPPQTTPRSLGASTATAAAGWGAAAGAPHGGNYHGNSRRATAVSRAFTVSAAASSQQPSEVQVPSPSTPTSTTPKKAKAKATRKPKEPPAAAAPQQPEVRWVSTYRQQTPDYAGAGATVPPPDAALPPGHIFLVDGMSLIFRAFFGWKNREPMLNSAGRDVSILHTFASHLLTLLELRPTHLTVCFDAKGKNFRHEMFSDYKANRPPTPPELIAAIPEVIELVQRMGIPLFQMSGVEADDIIGTIARRSVERGLHVTIVSPDKDFFQLLGPRVRQVRPSGKNFGSGVDNNNGGGAGFGDPLPQTGPKGLVAYTEEDFRDEFLGLDPEQFVDYLALVGDSSDNIPGVEFVGSKTAPKLLDEYGNIEGVLANASTVPNKRVRESLSSKKGADSAHLSRSLVKIRTHLNVPTINEPMLPIDALALRVPPQDGGAAVGAYLEAIELTTAVDRWRAVCTEAGYAAASSQQQQQQRQQPQQGQQGQQGQ